MDNSRGSRSGSAGHLDATGERKVVYCHQCANEWWDDEHGLVCPRCTCEVTEVVESNNDPRDLDSPADILPSPRDLQNHSPWANTDSDPEEADIEEHITHGPGGSIMISQTIRRSPVRRSSRNRPESSRRRSSIPFMRTREPDDPSSQEPFPAPRPARLMGMQRGYPSSTPERPDLIGSRVTTFTTGRLGGQGRATRNFPREPGGAPVDDITTLLSNLFGQMSPPPLGDHPAARDGPWQRPAGPNFPALLAALMNPANAASGDAVYTQEALDHVISQLMEQHPTSSSAPGPAAPQTISSLPKRNLTDKDLEGNKKVMGKNGVEEMKGECSVCMDDVGVGEEMVFLPCNHWFHEVCASAWLSEHDSCPICRKSICAESSPSNNIGSGSGESGSGSRRPFRRASGSMGAAFGTNWGSSNAFHNSFSQTHPDQPPARSPSIFTSAGRRERREREAERAAERNAESMEGTNFSSYVTRLADRERRRGEERAGSGSGGHSQWTSPSYDDNPSDFRNNVWQVGSSASGSRAESSSNSTGGLVGGSGDSGRRGTDRSTSSRYSTLGRPSPVDAGDAVGLGSGSASRSRSISPSERSMPGAFSSTPPRRDSARSSRSGSGSGSSGGGGMFSWVRDRFPSVGNRRDRDGAS